MSVTDDDLAADIADANRVLNDPCMRGKAVSPMTVRGLLAGIELLRSRAKAAGGIAAEALSACAHYEDEALPALRAEVAELRASLDQAVQSMSDLGRDLLIEGERADRAVAADERVRAVHREGDFMYGSKRRTCTHCVWPWPCPTIAALDGAADGETP